MQDASITWEVSFDHCWKCLPNIRPCCGVFYIKEFGLVRAHLKLEFLWHVSDLPQKGGNCHTLLYAMHARKESVGCCGKINVR